MPLACIAWFVWGRTGDRRPSRRRLSYRARDATASIFSSRAVARGFSVSANHRRDGLVWREDAHVFSIPGMRSRIDTIEADDDGNRRIWPTDVSTPRRSLPPSSDVQHQKRFPRKRSPATTLLASVERCSSDIAAAANLHVECRCQPSAVRTSPHPDKPGWWREKDTPSGSEHGSTAASTVVAGEAGQVAQTNDHVDRAPANKASISKRTVGCFGPTFCSVEFKRRVSLVHSNALTASLLQYVQ
jgi:hypothetical protein